MLMPVITDHLITNHSHIQTRKRPYFPAGCEGAVLAWKHSRPESWSRTCGRD